MRCFLVIVALVLGGVPAYAEEITAIPFAPPQPVAPAAASTLACKDFRRRPVRTVEVADLEDVGRAQFVGGAPVIMVNPQLMATLPPDLQTFFKLHECGHHVLGHIIAPTDKSEQEADCWAVQEGRKLGTFTKDDIIAWKPYFAASRGSKVGHLPGPQRVEFLLACFDE